MNKINTAQFIVLLLLATIIAPDSFADSNKKENNPKRIVEVEYLNAPSAAERDLPFSDAVKVGNLLFLSGKIGTIPGTMKLAEGGIQGQTRQTMDNIKASLNRYGATMDHVVKCTIFLRDIKEWGAMNEVYVTYFKKHKPARSALAASGLALDAAVEIECIASL